MELNRIASHLVALATGGMELGALTGMTAGFREREEVLHLLEFLTGLRMNHAFIRPGGLAQDFPEGCGREGHRLHQGHATRGCPTTTSCSPASRSGATGWRASATCRSTAAWRSAPPARSCAAPACRGTCARSSRTAATRSTTSRSRRRPRPTATPATGCGWRRCTSRSRSSSRPWRRCEPGPVMVEDRKIAWPAQLSVGTRRHGQLARARPQDHGPVDGVADPPLQAGHRGLRGAGRARCTRRSSRRAASWATTSSPTAAPGRCACTCASPAS